MTDIIVIAVVLLMVGGAVAYIIRAKKHGAKCIGCPESKTCGSKCSACSGCSGQCSSAD